MRKRSFSMALSLGLMACSFGAMNARAGTVAVTQDAGTYSFTVTSEGAGKLQIAYSDVLLTSINGSPIAGGSIASTFATEAVTATVISAVTLPIVGTITSYSISQPVSGVETLGTGSGVSSSAVLYDTQITGLTYTGFLNLTGTVTLGSPPKALLQTTTTGSTVYDFSTFIPPASIALTFNKVGANFAALIADPPGHTITGTGGFTQLAVPEPSSMALLGIGMSCLFALRRYVKWNDVA